MIDKSYMKLEFVSLNRMEHSHTHPYTRVHIDCYGHLMTGTNITMIHNISKATVAIAGVLQENFKKLPTALGEINYLRIVSKRKNTVYDLISDIHMKRYCSSLFSVFVIKHHAPKRFGKERKFISV